MPSAEQVTEGQLGQFHADIAAAFDTGLNLDLTIRQVDETLDWKAALVSTRVFFAAKPSTNSARVEFQDNGKIAFSINQRDDASLLLWVSWGEQWVKSTGRQRGRTGPTLDLVGVSICFLAGNAPKKRTQILRAEWDNPNRRGNDAAQPHWHIDPSLMDLPFCRAEGRAQVTGDLEELTAQENSFRELEPGFVGLKRLHLGMAGWKNRGDSPVCWQHRLELEYIADWLGRVLVYCKKELPRITIIH